VPEKRFRRNSQRFRSNAKPANQSKKRRSTWTEAMD